jgi:hypothetical protein
MTHTPQQNEQFGKPIGVDDVSPPVVEHGQRVAEHSAVETDSLYGAKVRFAVPMTDPPPPEEASAAAERGDDQKTGAPVSDARIVPEEPSAWESAPEGDEGLR